MTEDRELRRSAMRAVTLSDGEVLFRRGDPGDAFYIIEQGQIRIVTYDAADQEIALNLLGAGESFGELALVDGQPRWRVRSRSGSANCFACDGKPF
ncbi:MAG: cyclic nucleotide-binding domain-containing protein [Spirulinaceae cyanobacterium RM2_2_10]|nr:cyclic nucleotide-binding domain-containing protein [Spirulinaceae cyanobacterium RM2_2_10]